MTKYVKIDATCKCGKHLKSENRNPEDKSKNTTLMTCTSCKRKVRVEITGSKATVSYA